LVLDVDAEPDGAAEVVDPDDDSAGGEEDEDEDVDSVAGLLAAAFPFEPFEAARLSLR
jgi:hypothetical protein